MNKTLMAAGLAVVLGACNSSKKSDGVDISAVNPFFTEYTTPFGVPPFEQIKVKHYKPAFLKGMEEQTAEVEAIVNNPDKATFENTIVALDRSGEPSGSRHCAAPVPDIQQTVRTTLHISATHNNGTTMPSAASSACRTMQNTRRLYLITSRKYI